MCATQVLPENLTDDYTEESDSEVIGFIVVENKKYELKKGETKIGRDSTMCSIVIENFTISKVHAVIESEGIDDTFIYDVGSTNQTKLGKKILKPHCRYKLDNDSKLTLGNVSAKFVTATDKTSDYNSQTSRSENFDPLNELGDIFDVPTQVNCIQADTSSKSEKLPDNFQIFKIPHSVSAVKPSTSLKSCFEEVTQCSLNSKQRTVYYPGSLENSGIFSAGTQCQLYEPPAEQESDVQTLAGDNNKNSESDKIKLLLNDGEDDVLCCFMSLHSPEEQGGLVKEINPKSGLKGLTQVLDAPTQAHIETVEERERREVIEILQNKDFSKDFSTIHNPSVTSTPLGNKFIHPNCVSKKINVSVIEEDLIQTQEFSCVEAVKEAKDSNPSVTSTPLNNKFIHPDSGSKNSSAVDEDLIQTQEFNCLEVIKEAKEGKPSITSTPLNNKFTHPSSVSWNNSTRAADEDLILTQEFSCLESRKEINSKEDNISQDEETQPYLDETVDWSQQNEDLILTQTFGRVEKNLQTKETSKMVPETEEIIADGEDFLQTQIFPVEKEMKREAEILPKTLDTSFTHRNDEDDFISTQVFEESTNARNGNEKGDCDDKDDDNVNDEDFIATQKVEFPVGSGTSNRKMAKATSREGSPDLLVSNSFSKTYEDCISTQLFEGPLCQNVTTATAQQISNHMKENFNVAEPDNSGDETESDLEILLDETTTNAGQACSAVIKSEQLESNPQTSQNDDSNPSYIFEVEPENPSESVPEPPHLSDSDATDCEEIAVLSPKIRVKDEPREKMEFEETQVLTLTPADNFAEETFAPRDDWMTGSGQSPKFECESPLSLEMPNTQDIETTMNRILRSENEKEDTKKTEVGLTNGSITPKVESPLKRPLDRSSGEVVPVKKSKTEVSDRNSEKQLSKLVQAHDIGQIQPCRTRNSLRNVAKENKNVVSLVGSSINERPTSRRGANTKKGSTKNPNGDITQYLTKRVERKLSYGRQQLDASPSENQPVEGSDKRVLRSTSRNPAPVNPPNPRKSKRNSRTNEYCGGSCVNVAFTGFDCGILEKIISDLRGKKTNDLSSGVVVVADKVRRTVKFLCAIGLGLPIASPEWLLSCKREKKFLNPWDFILKDEESEEKWDFDLKASLEKSKKVKLLQGFSIFATKSTRPPVKDLLAIVEFCGGTPLSDRPDVWPKKTVVASCLEDKKWWPPAKLRNVRVVHYEFILTGVLRQKLDFKTHELR